MHFVVRSIVSGHLAAFLYYWAIGKLLAKTKTCKTHSQANYQLGHLRAEGDSALSLIVFGRSLSRIMPRISNLAYFVTFYVIVGWLLLPFVFIRSLFWFSNLAVLICSGTYLFVHLGKKLMFNSYF